MTLPPGERAYLLTALKDNFECQQPSIDFYASRIYRDKHAQKEYKLRCKKADACDKVASAFFKILPQNPTTYTEAENLVKSSIGLVGWLFIRWIAPLILRFLWDKFNERRIGLESPSS